MEKTTYGNYEIIIIDNGSVEKETIRYLESISKKEPKVRVVHDHGDFNFSRLNNHAFSQSKGDIYGLINNDIEVINQGSLNIPEAEEPFFTFLETSA